MRPVVGVSMQLLQKKAPFAHITHVSISLMLTNKK